VSTGKWDGNVAPIPFGVADASSLNGPRRVRDDNIFLHPSGERAQQTAPLYTTCIFCHNLLGSNDHIAHFPVGRRLAFDSAKGRFWEYPRAIRLGIEMALHENAERRAMDGELTELEAAWREAERVAGIADDLLLPPHMNVFMDRHRKQR
jgi:hypothetical protein